MIPSPRRSAWRVVDVRQPETAPLSLCCSSLASLSFRSSELPPPIPKVTASPSFSLSRAPRERERGILESSNKTNPLTRLHISLSIYCTSPFPPSKHPASTSAAALFGLGGSGAATKEKTDTVYDFTVTGIDGNKIPLSKFKGKVLVIAT